MGGRGASAGSIKNRERLMDRVSSLDSEIASTRNKIRDRMSSLPTNKIGDDKELTNLLVKRDSLLQEQNKLKKDIEKRYKYKYQGTYWETIK